LHIDPAPELVIEIDIPHPSLNKFPIFAGMGIPEVWRYHEQALTIFKLEGEAYRAQDASETFPRLTSADVTRLIGESYRLKRPEWMSSVRELVRALKLQSR
jgi:Uma2 family endonuclease